MAKRDKMITYAYLREECDLPVHLPEIELESKIYRSQETLRMLLCEEFYFDLLDKYVNNTMTDQYNTLMPYIKQFLAWQTHEYWVRKSNYKYTLSGIRTHSEPNSTPISDLQMGILIKDAVYQSEYYKRLMISYIETNSANYPLYCACGAPSKGNVFHVSAVKNKHRSPQPFGTRHFSTCNCGCND